MFFPLYWDLPPPHLASQHIWYVLEMLFWNKFWIFLFQIDDFIFLAISLFSLIISSIPFLGCGLMGTWWVMGWRIMIVRHLNRGLLSYKMKMGSDHWEGCYAICWK